MSTEVNKRKPAYRKPRHLPATRKEEDQMTTDTERETFEAWVTKDCGDLSTFGSGENKHYRNSGVNQAWIGFKAGRASIAHQPSPGLCDEYVGGLEYRGNSVGYIHQKLTAYHKSIDEAWQAMRDAGLGPDGKTKLADAIRAALAAAPQPPQQPIDKDRKSVV